VKNYVGSVLPVALLIVIAHPALAYVGPGAGITMLGALWGVISAIVVALAAVLFWPIRALVRKRRKVATAPTEPPTQK
jgi:hypothetical protein